MKLDAATVMIVQFSINGNVICICEVIAQNPLLGTVP